MPGAGYAKPFCRPRLASDLRWSTVLCSPHLIANEGRCSQQFLSTLHGTKETAESGAHTSTDGAQDIPAPPLGTGKEKAANVTSVMVTNPLLPQVGHLQQKPGLEIRMPSTLPSVTLSR